MCIRSVILKPQFTLGDVHGCRRHSRATQRRRFEAFHRGRRRLLRSGRPLCCRLWSGGVAEQLAGRIFDKPLTHARPIGHSPVPSRSPGSHGPRQSGPKVGETAEAEQRRAAHRLLDVPDSRRGQVPLHGLQPLLQPEVHTSTPRPPPAPGPVRSASVRPVRPGVQAHRSSQGPHEEDPQHILVQPAAFSKRGLVSCQRCPVSGCGGSGGFDGAPAARSAFPAHFLPIARLKRIPKDKFKNDFWIFVAASARF